MKTTFKQYLQEAVLPKAESEKDLLKSIKHDIFTLDGSHLELTGSFSCSSGKIKLNQLSSLVGAPKTVGGFFSCNDNNLKSLMGAPTTVGGYFTCVSNQLTSLVGAPESVGSRFSCARNQLKSLKGAPSSINGGFNCSENQLTSLEGAPRSVSGYFSCDENQLTSLEGAPRSVGSFHCMDNNLASLKDVHKHLPEIGSRADFRNNPIKSHVLGLLKIRNLQSVELGNKKVEEIINKYLPEGDIFACQQELIDAGFEEYAQL